MKQKFKNTIKYLKKSSKKRGKRMRKKKRLKLIGEMSLIITILLTCFINFGNHSAISQENAESKGVDIKKFSKEYQTSKLKFKFTYLCDEVIDEIFEKEKARAIKKDVGLDRTFFLEITAVELTKFDPTKLVFVQKGEQFEIEKSYFEAIIGKKRVYKEIYPEVFIKGLLFLPFSFDPTISATIWYEKEKLGSFAIPGEYKDLLFITREPPVGIYLYPFHPYEFKSYAKEKEIPIKFELRDEYGVCTVSNGIINCQLYSLKDRELLYEEKRQVSYKDFIMETSSSSLYGRLKTKLVYKWKIDKCKIAFEKMMEEERNVAVGESGSYYVGELIFGYKPNAILIVSFALPTGEVLKVEEKIGISPYTPISKITR